MQSVVWWTGQTFPGFTSIPVWMQKWPVAFGLVLIRNAISETIEM